MGGEVYTKIEENFFSQPRGPTNDGVRGLKKYISWGRGILDVGAISGNNEADS